MGRKTWFLVIKPTGTMQLHSEGRVVWSAAPAFASGGKPEVSIAEAFRFLRDRGQEVHLLELLHERGRPQDERSYELVTYPIGADRPLALGEAVAASDCQDVGGMDWGD